MLGICRSSWILCLYEIENKNGEVLGVCLPKNIRKRKVLGIDS